MTTFQQEIGFAANRLENYSKIVHTEKWQGMDISKMPEAATHEIRHHFMNVPMVTEDLNYHREQIGPNLPWADDHFEERVCGWPINPGTQWAKWPYARSAEKFLDDKGQFNHNYMERYWPQFAGMITATPDAASFKSRLFNVYGDEELRESQNKGIYHPYGSLNDVVKQLAREPLTRQAILPVFFPEDTGAVHGSRVPCSLAYQFMMRDGRLDVSYWLRSCDFVRHFRDDIYLTVRLALWILQEVRKLNPDWNDVVPGNYVMLISSLHLFRNDYIQLFGSK